jgi:hypothetical protein
MTAFEQRACQLLNYLNTLNNFLRTAADKCPPEQSGQNGGQPHRNGSTFATCDQAGR